MDWVLLWGSPESLREIKALVSMIENAQNQFLKDVEGKETPAQPPPRSSGPFA